MQGIVVLIKYVLKGYLRTHTVPVFGSKISFDVPHEPGRQVDLEHTSKSTCYQQQIIVAKALEYGSSLAS